MSEEAGTPRRPYASLGHEEKLQYHRDRKREWYARNRDEQNARMREKARATKAELVAMKGGSCVDCGFAGDPVCFHFDHRDPWEKEGRVQDFTQKGNRTALLVELEKCDLVCANCHAIRTSQSTEVKKKITRGRLSAREERHALAGLPGPYDARAALLYEVLQASLPEYAEAVAAKGLAARTVAAYTTDVRALVRWAEYRRLPADTHLGEAISRFIQAQKHERSAIATVKRLESSLSSFARFIQALDHD